MDEVVRRVRELIAGVSEQDVSEFRVGSHKVVFNPVFFKEVVSRDGVVGFVDGGSAEVLSAPGLSVFFLRVYAAVYKCGVRVSRVCREGFVIVRVQREGGGLVYVVECVGLSLVIPYISVDDVELRFGSQMVTPVAVVGVVRRVLECELADSLDVDCVVCDGALQDCPEDRFCGVRLSRAVHVGVCKTTSALTDSGLSVPFFLESRGPRGVWVYDCPSGEVVKSGFVRLHDVSERVFRVDVRNGSLQDAVGFLLPFCADASFVGYPYGLVDADVMACVREEERLVLRNVFFVRCGVRGLEQDAHDVLNIMH